MSNPVLSFFNNPFIWWLFLGPSVRDVGWLPFLIWCFLGLAISYAIPLVLPIVLISELGAHIQHRTVDPGSCIVRVSGGCGFVGNSDVYGLGVRLGVYLQWISTVLANVYLPNERRGMVAASLAYSIAMFIALLVLVFDGSCLYMVEVIVLLYLLVGGVTSIAGTYRSFTDARNTQLKTGIDLAWLFSSPSILFFSHWFWIGMSKDQLQLDSFFPTPCGTSFFLMARVSELHIRLVGRIYAFLSISIHISSAFRTFSILFENFGLKNAALLCTILSVNVYDLVAAVVGLLAGCAVGFVDGLHSRPEDGIILATKKVVQLGQIQLASFSTYA
jgi:hypothetical protein